METLVKTKPALAFAGAGWIGRNRMKAAIDCAVADIAIVTDPSDECVQEVLKMAPSCKSLSFEEAIACPDIDGVVIATPSALHMQQSLLAFSNKKAVFCQKPLGRNALEVAAVINAAKDANKLLGTDFSYRYTRAFQKILPIIQSGELGQLYAIDLKFHNAYGPGKPWFYDMNQSGGGCVLDLGIHLVDLMLYALNFPAVTNVRSNLYSKGIPVKKRNLVEDFASVTMNVAEINVHLSCSWNLHAGCEAEIELSFYGTAGGVVMKNVNGSFYDFTAARNWGTKTEILDEPPDPWGGRALIDWIQQLSLSAAFNHSAEKYLDSAKVVDSIYGCK